MLLSFVGILLVSGHVSALALNDMAARRALAGWIANGFLVILYISPLSTLAKVIKQRSSASLHWPLSLTSVLNGSFWFVYGVAVKDLFIGIPNGLGALLAAFQLFLCVIFPARKAA